MGGVVVDGDGQTSCEGLFAAGEVAAGAHGANRLGGNALAEVIAMGSLVGKAAADKALGLDRADGFDAAMEEELNGMKALCGSQGPGPGELVQGLKKVMWLNAGIVRSRESLERALETVAGFKETRAAVDSADQLIRFLEFRNMRFAGEMVCRAALERTESRGSHCRSDFPDENNDAWVVNIRIRQTPDGPVLEKVPVPS
jgi:succinate dehydrogenase/fumarate reductase flavoprotein subunit